MTVTVCIGSSCHLKGSRLIVEGLQRLIASKNLGDRIELCGAFCVNNCENGVCVKVDDKLFSVMPENIDNFFETEILPRLEGSAIT